MAVFSESTIAAAKFYLPERKDAASFLQLINAWWMTESLKRRICSNKLANALVKNYGKLIFAVKWQVGSVHGKQKPTCSVFQSKHLKVCSAQCLLIKVYVMIFLKKVMISL